MYVLRRVLLLIPVLLGLTIITFTLSNVVTDPTSAWTTDRTPPAVVEQIRKAHHFDEPFFVQYYYYLSDLFHGDWGLSHSQSDEPVLSVIRRTFPATVELATFATIIQISVGLPLGIISAVKKDKALDHGSRLLALSGASFPVFWLALMMQFVFFYTLKLHGLPYLPSAGQVDSLVELNHPLKTVTGFVILDSLLTWNIPVFKDALAHIILPAICDGFTGLGLITRITRSSMLEVLRQDYVTLARAKGLTERTVIYKHALKNAINPSITIIGTSFGFILAGAPLTETVFSWPGMGKWAAYAIVSLDRASIMGFVLVTGMIYVVVNLLVDVLYSVVDPRVRYG
jgi:ABC-type dipeptide/oligopeptide/nickel transport system permease component